MMQLVENTFCFINFLDLREAWLFLYLIQEETYGLFIDNKNSEIIILWVKSLLHNYDQLNIQN